MGFDDTDPLTIDDVFREEIKKVENSFDHSKEINHLPYQFGFKDKKAESTDFGICSNKLDKLKVNDKRLSTNFKIENKCKRDVNCYFCDQIFPFEKDFMKHLSCVNKSLKKKYKNKNLECDFCGNLFFTKCGLRHHVVTNYKNIPCNLRCHNCKMQFNFTCDFLSHMKNCHLTQSNSSNFVCSYCSKICKTNKILELHLERHKLFSCKYCKVLFSKVLLHEHLLKCYKKPEMKFQCPKCVRKFISKANLSWHLKCLHRRRRKS